MAKQNTTVKQASGGGYQFENEAVAYILAHLLNRSSPFGLPQGGVIEQVAVQRPATEWHLDDLVVTVRAHGYKHQLAFSIKSNTQISTSGLPADFVRDAWEHLLHDTSTVFDESRDYLGLITVPADRKLQDAVYELLRLARDQSPSSLANQIDLPRRTNDLVRRLFKSAECPEDLATKHVIEKRSAGRLLRRVLWLPLDFEDQNSLNRGRADEICLHLLRSGNIEEAQALWAKLKEVAERLRRSGGDIDLGRLADELRRQFELLHFPNYGADWERLSDDAESALRRVRSMIGGVVTLPRLPEHEKVNQAFREHRIVVLLGASGTGKSAIARGQAERAIEGGRALWLDSGRLRARTFAEWRPHLGLDHSLSEIVRTITAANALLVLDDLDRLYDNPGFATAAEFIRAVQLDDATSAWRVLITCTPEAWDRVRGELASHGGLPAKLGMVNIGPPAADELSVVWSAFPQLLPLQARYYLAPVLFRPKVLDLLATRARAGDDLRTVGESDLAGWFWGREVAYGPHSVIRAEAARQIAQYLADELAPDVSVSALATAVGVTNLTGIDELAEGHVLRRAEGRIAFDHDLYGDWVRLRQLVGVDEAGELSDFLAPRLSSPVWHRALRLYGIHLLEQSNDLKPWTSAFAAAGRIPAPAGILAQDVLLESMAFASASGPGLFRNGVWPLLAEYDGRLLVRLLNRLLHTATIPNPAVLEVIVGQKPELAIHAAAWARLPYPFYWFDILALLNTHREEVPFRIRGVAARAAELWLRATSPEWPLRKEAAGLAVALGEALLKDKEERDVLFLDDETDQQVYRAVLASGHEEPQAVTQIVLEASGRRARRHKPPPLSQEELARLREMRQKYAGWSFVQPSGPLPKPWPHGPAFRVDGALQKVVLESDALRPLAQANPPLALELVLALLIREPERRRDDDYILHDRLALEWPSWQPPFYTHGPFRVFLATAEEDAVTAILRLVDHATDRWAEAVTHNYARERRCTPNGVPPMAPILVHAEERGFIGNAQVFGWSQGNPDSGGVIGSILTGLEKHLYDRVEAGNDITPLVQRLLAESRSLAMVGLLSMFGRRYPQYLRGPLRGLLVSPHVLEWTFIQSASMWWELPLQWGLVPEPPFPNSSDTLRRLI
jgi:tryptophan 2,3-dioxygenase